MGVARAGSGSPRAVMCTRARIWLALGAVLACGCQSGCSSTSGAPPVDFAQLVQGVGSVCAWGLSGPLRAGNADFVPIVAGDADTDPPGAVVAMAAVVGRGRIVALGHEGFLTGEGLPLHDNSRFARNSLAWLDLRGGRRIVATTGHEEWLGGAALDPLRDLLVGRGYEVTDLPGSITPAGLANADVVLLGNAWGPITEAEINVLDGFVRGGGGALIIGLGWSWRQYQGPLADYPMNQVGERFGIRWQGGVVTDPTNHQGEWPVFHVFCPTLDRATAAGPLP